MYFVGHFFGNGTNETDTLATVTDDQSSAYQTYVDQRYTTLAGTERRKAEERRQGRVLLDAFSSRDGKPRKQKLKSTRPGRGLLETAVSCYSGDHV